MESFGKTLRTARRRKGLTQRELAAECGIDFSYISKLENDRCNTMPSAALVFDLSVVLGVDPDSLIRLARPNDVKLLKQRIAELEAALSLGLQHIDYIGNNTKDEDSRAAADSAQKIMRKALEGGE